MRVAGQFDGKSTYILPCSLYEIISIFVALLPTICVAIMQKAEFLTCQ